MPSDGDPRRASCLRRRYSAICSGVSQGRAVDPPANWALFVIAPPNRRQATLSSRSFVPLQLAGLAHMRPSAEIPTSFAEV